MAHKKLSKQLLQPRVVQWLLTGLVSFIIRFIYVTNRVTKIFPDATLPYVRGEKPAIFCFWHGRMIFHPFVKPPGKKMFVLISNHNDGALITTTMRWFGIGSVRGSRKKGGAHALRELFKVTEAGDNISITPDGPRGPFQEAAEGAAYVASKAGYPLVPISFSASRYWRFKSWDRFLLPKPFGRAIFVTASPIYVTADADEATLKTTTAVLQAELVRITNEADQHCGIAA